MALISSDVACRIGSVCRDVAAALIAGVLRRRSIGEVSRAIKARPVRQQAGIVFSVLAMLFACSLVAAQFGWIGMLVFWLAVIVLVK